MSIYVQSVKQYDQRSERGVFILAHLLEIVDAVQVSDEFIYHPGDSVTIQGYFMDNSSKPDKVRLRFVAAEDPDDQARWQYSEVCSTLVATQITCQIAESHTLYGYLMVNLIEAQDLSTHTFITLSD